MEKKSKVSFKRFKIIFSFLVIIFICLYFASQTGYYERNISRQTVLTKEALLEFEKDVEEGKNVDIKDYLPKPKTDYASTSSKIGHNISNFIDSLLNDGVGYIFKFLKALFT